MAPGPAGVWRGFGHRVRRLDATLTASGLQQRNLIQCIAADSALRAGFALMYRSVFPELIPPPFTVNVGSAVLVPLGKYVHVFLVTKSLSHHKPTFAAFAAAVRHAGELLQQLPLMPRVLYGPLLGCGRDQLSWDAVRELLRTLPVGLRLFARSPSPEGYHARACAESWPVRLGAAATWRQLPPAVAELPPTAEDAHSQLASPPPDTDPTSLEPTPSLASVEKWRESPPPGLPTPEARRVAPGYARGTVGAARQRFCGAYPMRAAGTRGLTRGASSAFTAHVPLALEAQRAKPQAPREALEGFAVPQQVYMRWDRAVDPPAIEPPKRARVVPWNIVTWPAWCRLVVRLLQCPLVWRRRLAAGLGLQITVPSGAVEDLGGLDSWLGPAVADLRLLLLHYAPRSAAMQREALTQITFCYPAAKHSDLPLNGGAGVLFVGGFGDGGQLVFAGRPLEPTGPIVADFRALHAVQPFHAARVAMIFFRPGNELAVEEVMRTREVPARLRCPQVADLPPPRADAEMRSVWEALAEDLSDHAIMNHLRRVRDAQALALADEAAAYPLKPVPPTTVSPAYLRAAWEAGYTGLRPLLGEEWAALRGYSDSPWLGLEVVRGSLFWGAAQRPEPPRLSVGQWAMCVAPTDPGDKVLPKEAVRAPPLLVPLPAPGASTGNRESVEARVAREVVELLRRFPRAFWEYVRIWPLLDKLRGVCRLITHPAISNAMTPSPGDPLLPFASELARACFGPHAEAIFLFADAVTAFYQLLASAAMRATWRVRAPPYVAGQGTWFATRLLMGDTTSVEVCQAAFSATVGVPPEARVAPFTGQLPAECVGYAQPRHATRPVASAVHAQVQQAMRAQVDVAVVPPCTPPDLVADLAAPGYLGGDLRGAGRGGEGPRVAVPGQPVTDHFAWSLFPTGTPPYLFGNAACYIDGAWVWRASAVNHFLAHLLRSGWTVSQLEALVRVGDFDGVSWDGVTLSWRVRDKRCAKLEARPTRGRVTLGDLLSHVCSAFAACVHLGLSFKHFPYASAFLTIPGDPNEVVSLDEPARAPLARELRGLTLLCTRRLRRCLWAPAAARPCVAAYVDACEVGEWGHGGWGFVARVQEHYGAANQYLCARGPYPPRTTKAGSGCLELHAATICVNALTRWRGAIILLFTDSKNTFEWLTGLRITDAGVARRVAFVWALLEHTHCKLVVTYVPGSENFSDVVSRSLRLPGPGVCFVDRHSPPQRFCPSGPFRHAETPIGRHLLPGEARWLPEEQAAAEQILFEYASYDHRTPRCCQDAPLVCDLGDPQGAECGMGRVSYSSAVHPVSGQPVALPIRPVPRRLPPRPTTFHDEPLRRTSELGGAVPVPADCPLLRVPLMSDAEAMAMPFARAR